MPPDSLSPETPVFWFHLGVALLCGGTIGLERQIRGKAAGVRTSILICLGTSLFVALGVTTAPDRSDATRVLGQVVTGIGFLGAGVILTREGRLLGVTTAAVIWVLAAIGSLIGIGHFAAAVVITLVTLAVLLGVEAIESFVERRRGPRDTREQEGSSSERRPRMGGRRSGDGRGEPFEFSDRG
ncbi:MAG: MgtC/SapB family protein [Gemmatimonadales bacterium]